MAFVKKTWKDRIAEFPTRRRLTKSNGDSELVTVAREEGTISQEGDAFSAENMNDLESRVDNAISEINSNLSDDCIRYPSMSNLIANMDITSTSSDCAYTATENCWAYFDAYKANEHSANDCIIFINGEEISYAYLQNNYDSLNVFVPLKKGDVIKFNTASFYKKYSIYGVR